MIKRKLDKFILYKYRFLIGYVLITLAFLLMIFGLPLLSPDGLSQQEIQSAITAKGVSQKEILKGNLVSLPYLLLQRVSLEILGFNNYAIKLPSVLLAVLLAVFMVLLLNRWFKSNVALLTSTLVVLSVPFLYLAGVGDGSIMIVLWMTIMLWLGSKINNNPKPNPYLLVSFSFVGLLSLFTPQMIFMLGLIVIYATINPHFRFTVKNLPILAKILVTFNLALSGFVVGYMFLFNSHSFNELLWGKFISGGFLSNIRTGVAPFFAWHNVVDSILLSPLISLSVFALMMIGLIANLKKFFTTKLFLASGLVGMGVVLTGFNSMNSLMLLIPVAVLLAYGLQYVLMRWYDIFPENPYARLFAMIPIGVFLVVTLTSNFSHFVYGYKYIPTVANYFNNDLTLIYQNLEEGSKLLVPAGGLEYDFYINLRGVKISSNTPDPTVDKKIARLKSWSEKMSEKYKLSQIITSPNLRDSDRIYLYTVKD